MKIVIKRRKKHGFQKCNKKGSLVATLILNLTAFAVPAAHAEMNEKEASQNLVNSLKVAMEAKRELNATGHFVPMPNAELPNTASHEQTYMLIGGLIVLLGAAALVPAVRLARKVEQA